jgi:hypothetical protein
MLSRLILLLDEDIASGLPPSAQAKAAREPLYEAIKDISKLATDRVRMGEDNFRGPVFFNAATALIHAKATGMPPDQIVPDAAKRSANECLEILTSRMKKTAPDGVTLGDQLESSTSAADQMIGEPDFGFDLMMPDAYMGGFGMEEGFGFPMGESWLFTSWDAN